MQHAGLRLRFLLKALRLLTTLKREKQSERQSQSDKLKDRTHRETMTVRRTVRAVTDVLD